jgi:KaiC/GvpD/RAD55 family RecA-like ATPase
MAKFEEKFNEKVKNLNEYVALAAVDAKTYQAANLAIVKDLVNNKNIPGVYVTLNKPFKVMKKIFEDQKIDTRMVIFIDALTKTSEGVKKTDECLFIGAPDNLTDISIAMDQAVRALPQNQRFLFFDSLSTLLLYNNADTVARFIHFMAGKMHEWKVKGIIVTLRKKKDKELINELMQFCDVVLDL